LAPCVVSGDAGGLFLEVYMAVSKEKRRQQKEAHDKKREEARSKRLENRHERKEKKQGKINASTKEGK
jgi:hypothetical protein